MMSFVKVRNQQILSKEVENQGIIQKYTFKVNHQKQKETLNNSRRYKYPKQSKKITYDLILIQNLDLLYSRNNVKLKTHIQTHKHAHRHRERELGVEKVIWGKCRQKERGSLP